MILNFLVLLSTQHLGLQQSSGSKLGKRCKRQNVRASWRHRRTWGFSVLATYSTFYSCFKTDEKQWNIFFSKKNLKQQTKTKILLWKENQDKTNLRFCWFGSCCSFRGFLSVLRSNVYLRKQWLSSPLIAPSLSLSHTHTLALFLTLSLTNCWSTNKISCLPPNPIKSNWNKGLSFPSGGSTDEVCCVFRFRPKIFLTVKLVILSLTRVWPSSGWQKQHRFRRLKCFFQCH